MMLALLTMLFGTTKLHAYRVCPLPCQFELPVATMRCVFQDRHGLMWYGTVGGGLCRDDGYQIQTFRPDISIGAPVGSRTINALCEDGDGNLWIATNDGLYVLQNDFSTIREPLHIRGRISTIVNGANGLLWCLSQQEGVIRFNPTDVSQVKRWTNLKGEAVSLLSDSRRRVWVGTREKGLFLWDRKTDEFQVTPLQSNRMLSFLLEDTEADALWIVEHGKGFLFYDISKGEAIPQPLTSPNLNATRVIDAIIDSRQGLLWVTTMNDLYVYQRKGTQLQPFDTSDFLPRTYRIIDRLYEDRDGNIWIAGLSPSTFIVTLDDEKIVRQPVASMLATTGFSLQAERVIPDARGWWLWQTRCGLMFYDTTDASLHENKGYKFSYCIERQADANGLWAAKGPELYGVSYQNGCIAEVPVTTLPEAIHTICDDGCGHLYIGTRHALYVWSTLGKQLRKLVTLHAAPVVTCPTSDGNVWMLDERGILYYITYQGNVAKVKMRKGVQLSAITLASDATLWAVSHQGELFFMPKRIVAADSLLLELYMSADEVPTMHRPLIDVKVDGRNHVWLLANQCVCELNPANGAFRLYERSDPQIDVDLFYHMEKVDEQHLAIGGARAFCVLESSEELDGLSVRQTPIYVSAIEVQDSVVLPVVGQKELEIASDISSVVLHCTTLDALYADRISIAYRLKGEGERWNYLPQGMAGIYLNNLPYGVSRIELKSTDRNGCWGTTSTCFEIYRNRPWWCMWPALLLFSLVAISISYVAWRIYKKTRELSLLQRRQEQLELTTIHILSDQQESNLDDQLLKKAIACVEQHLADADYSVEKMSCDMCMSRMSLYRQLQRLTGMPPTEFIRDIRLKKAAAFLRNHPDISSSQLARHVGFATPAYFRKCFKMKFGVMPSDYATQHIGQENIESNG